MKKLLLPAEIAAWLLRQASTAKNPRCHAQREGEIIRYYHPCGHTSWEPRSSGIEIFMINDRWAWNHGGVGCTCPRCFKLKVAEDKKNRKNTMRPLQRLTRTGPDWVSS